MSDSIRPTSRPPCGTVFSAGVVSASVDSAELAVSDAAVSADDAVSPPVVSSPSCGMASVDPAVVGDSSATSPSSSLDPHAAASSHQDQHER